MYLVGWIVRPAMLELLEAGQILQYYLNRRRIISETITSLDLEEFRLFYNSLIQRVDRYEQVIVQLEVAGVEGLNVEDVAKFNVQLQVVCAAAISLRAYYENKALACNKGDSGSVPGSSESFAYERGLRFDIYNYIE